MTKLDYLPCLILFCILAAGCGAKSTTQPAVLRNAESYTSEGLQAYEAAQWDRAQWSFIRALKLYEGIDDLQGMLYSHINLAEVALSVRDYPTALDHLGQADKITKNASFRHFQNRIQLLYALTALKQKQINQAEHILQPLLPAFEGNQLLTDPDIIQLSAIANRTKIAFLQQQDESLWTERYENALKRSLGKNPGYQSRLLRFQSDLLQRQGNYEKAESKLQQALSYYKSIFSRSGIAATLSELGNLYSAQGRWKDAQQVFNRSITVYRHLGDLTKVVQVTENLAIVEAELGHPENSRKLHQWIADIKAGQASRRNKMGKDQPAD